LLLVAGCSFLLAGRALSPIRKLNVLAGSLTAADLSRRIEPGRVEKEFRELIEVFNGMLDRLERSFGQARRFGHDSAHELNTPLTVLTSRIGEALRAAPVGSEEQMRLAEIAKEVDRIAEIVRKLALLARIDGGGFQCERTVFDLRQTCEQAVAEMAEGYPGIAFEMKEGAAVSVSADPGLTRQVLLNLLSNGARYNRKGGRVTVSVDGIGNRGRCAVGNTGPAIPVELRERIFDRFARGDTSRNEEKGGLGLGLSLASEFVKAMGGELRLDGVDEDEILFVLELPGGGGRND